MKTVVIIFSKDRAMQVQATLDSFYRHCTDAKEAVVKVIYRASQPTFEEGYRMLRQRMPDGIEWVAETDFRENLLSCLRVKNPRLGLLARLLGRDYSPVAENVLFLVDDNIFVRPFALSVAGRAIAEESRLLGFSLRVGRNTTYCYSNSCDQPLPAFQEAADGTLRFSWPGEIGDFGYPLEVSSSVYSTEMVLGLLRHMPFTNPNRLEQGLSVARLLFTKRKPQLACFERSVAFCAPVNKVQSVVDNRAGSNVEYSSEELNRWYLSGTRIAVEELDDFVPNACHQEIPLPLRPS